MSSSSQAGVASSSHQDTAASSAQRTKEARDAFTASLKSEGAIIDAELQARAKNIHANSKALTKQEDDLRKQTKALSKESDSLQKLVDKTNKELQGLGDLDALMADLDADLAMIEETIRIAEDSDEEVEGGEPPEVLATSNNPRPGT